MENTCKLYYSFNVRNYDVIIYNVINMILNKCIKTVLYVLVFIKIMIPWQC